MQTDPTSFLSCKSQSDACGCTRKSAHKKQLVQKLTSFDKGRIYFSVRWCKVGISHIHIGMSHIVQIHGLLSQAELCNRIAVELGFNLENGRLDVSVHPFTGGKSFILKFSRELRAVDLL